MKEQPIAHVLHELAEQAVPADLDLWPAIRTRVATSRPSRRPMASVRFKIAVGLTLLALTLIGLLVVIPGAQAMVTDMLQRFGIVLIQPASSKSTPEAAPPTGPQPQAVVQAVPQVTLDEARRAIPFPIPLPTWLPAGLVVGGAHVLPPDWAQVFYVREDGAPGGMGIEITQGKRSGGYAFPSSDVQEVMVNGHPALYVHGAWHSDGGWDSTPDAGTLSWEAGGLTFVLSYSELGLSRADLMRIAESLR